MYKVTIEGTILTSAHLLSVRNELIELCKEHGVSFLAMTGHINDGIVRPTNAAHFVYDYDPTKISPRVIYTFQKSLEGLLGKKVHLIYSNWQGDAALDFVMKTAQIVYGSLGRK